MAARAVRYGILVSLVAALLHATGCSGAWQVFRRADPDAAPALCLCALTTEEPFGGTHECGLNALYKVLKYYAADVKPAALAVRDPGAPPKGYAAFELAAIARTLGFACRFGPMHPAELEAHIDAGRPVIALVSDTGLAAGPAHWVVVYGRDAARKVVFVDWCARGERGTMGRSAFLRLWRARGNEAVLVSGRGPTGDTKEGPK